LRALVISAGGGIGDVLLATPVMRALRSRYDEVVALTSERHRAILEHDPDLAGVWTSAEAFGALSRRIESGRFDACVVTWATARFAALPFAARIPRRVGQSRRPYSRLFTDRVEVRSERGDRTTHWTQILLDYARALDCDVADATPIFAIGAPDCAEAEAALAAGGVAAPYLLFHPTRGISSERPAWPVGHLGGLARELGQRFGMQIVVSGATADRAAAESIAGDAGGVSIAGRVSIGGFAAIAQSAHAVVAMDSGPMHVAAAVGAPTVGIFAMQPDEPDRWRPLGPRVAIVRPSYPCPPAHRKENCPDFACVAALPFADVIAQTLAVCAA
jgi:ADP-heptose:LPS heptosyltransferase